MVGNGCSNVVLISHRLHQAHCATRRIGHTVADHIDSSPAVANACVTNAHPRPPRHHRGVWQVGCLCNLACIDGFRADFVTLQVVPLLLKLCTLYRDSDSMIKAATSVRCIMH